jgi:hypothetical protein
MIGPSVPPPRTAGRVAILRHQVLLRSEAPLVVRREATLNPRAFTGHRVCRDESR